MEDGKGQGWYRLNFQWITDHNHETQLKKTKPTTSTNGNNENEEVSAPELKTISQL
ncbi:MAG: hypothetical protein GY782_03495 [Gammaproteobacteria bacterium]|nr:hypothetical protein [Gammaproteobacteria bacterium]